MGVHVGSPRKPGLDGGSPQPEALILVPMQIFPGEVVFPNRHQLGLSMCGLQKPLPAGASLVGGVASLVLTSPSGLFRGSSLCFQRACACTPHLVAQPEARGHVLSFPKVKTRMPWSCGVLRRLCLPHPLRGSGARWGLQMGS